MTSKAIPKVKLEENVEVKVIAGRLSDVEEPVNESMVPVDYFDVTMSGKGKFSYCIPQEKNAFAYVFRGSVADGGRSLARTGRLAVLSEGEVISFETDQGGARFLLASGEPLNEPIAWGGPIIMNTEEELDTTSLDPRKGTFVKSRSVN